MNNENILTLLLIISIILGIILTFIATASTGRTISDLERQIERGIVGSPRIQVWTNLRLYFRELAFGTVFITINIMLLVGAPEPWRMWTNRILWTTLLLGYVIAAIMDWLAEREQVQISLRALQKTRDARDVLVAEAETRRVEDVTEIQKSYQKIAEVAVTNLEDATNKILVASGKPPLSTMADVVPEHNSPTTKQQTETAAAATLRARLVAATLALGLPPRTETDK